MNQPRVFIAYDHPVLLDAFRILLVRHCEFRGASTNGQGPVVEAERLMPDVIVAELSMLTHS